MTFYENLLHVSHCMGRILKIISDIYSKTHWKIIFCLNLQLKETGLRKYRYLAQGHGTKSE